MRRRRPAPEPGERVYADPPGDPPRHAATARCCSTSATSCSPARVPTYPPFSESAFISYSFGPCDGNSWRTDTDVGVPGDVPFSTRCCATCDADATAAFGGGPGHWNDPDYLGPDQGMSDDPVPDAVQHVGDARGAADVQRQHARRSARRACDDLQHAGDRDRPGPGRHPGAWSISRGRDGSGRPQRRGLEEAAVGGSYAVALLNLDNAATLSISTTTAAIGMQKAASYKVANVWAGGTSSTTGLISATVAPHQTVVYIVTPS